MTWVVGRRWRSGKCDSFFPPLRCLPIVWRPSDAPAPNLTPRIQFTRYTRLSLLLIVVQHRRQLLPHVNVILQHYSETSDHISDCPQRQKGVNKWCVNNKQVLVTFLPALWGGDNTSSRETTLFIYPLWCNIAKTRGAECNGLISSDKSIDWKIIKYLRVST